ncbi:LytTR family transcriptional regulator [Reichenbachiella agarivorans]|uniref:LytTR family transcriptional regulator n=1 Tax=Reichenbachiella agarivorans TaxID=2979464 RepID=A0ABY6CRK2_9BACT|nr:LytTR family DNA-binding domain-containing protein [Reichenbachiella agarivorans]UXP33142.1 LytTR family transcriptional regulator [Reichenbachiella agarivorans]
MKIVGHILFWITITGLLTLIFGRSYQSFSESFYFVCLLLPVIVGTAYFFNYYIVVKYLFARRYFKFVLYSFYLLIISLNLEMLVITTAFILLAEYDYANMNPITTDVSILTITLYFVVFGLSFIRLIRFYFHNQKSISYYQDEVEKSKIDSITIKENRSNRQVFFEDIRYIESLGDYVTIHLFNEKIITKEKISSLENRMPQIFVRIHRSFMVNRLHISSFNKEQITIANQTLPISRTYKQKVFSSLN